MTKEDFKGLFYGALEDAAKRADNQLSIPIPRTFLIELHGAGCSDQRVGAEEALDRLYVSDERFYKIIDLAVIAITSNKSVVFARVSGHATVDYEQTWSPQERGPFKQLESAKIEDQRT